jgi:hypothetical protein
MEGKNMDVITEDYVRKVKKWKEKMSVPACPNVSGCISKEEACAGSNQMNSSCSSWCDTSQTKVKVGTSLNCVNKNIGEVLFDAIGDAVDDAGKDLLGLSGVKQILIYIAIGLVILVVGYMVIQFIINIVAKK